MRSNRKSTGPVTENPPRMLTTHARTGRTRPHSLMLVLLLSLTAVYLSGCGGVSMPKVSLPKLPDFRGDEEQPMVDSAGGENVDVTATPRDLLTAHLVNPRADPASPPLTVGKLIEFSATGSAPPRAID